MTIPLRFDVLGIPAPQGSKRHVGNGRMVESSRKIGPWRDSVAWTARHEAADAGVEQFTGPTSIQITFRLPMPKARPSATRKRGLAWSMRKPDLDKLTRSTLDALVTAGVLSDDSIVSRLDVAKIETTSWTGAAIRIAPQVDEPQVGAA